MTADAAAPTLIVQNVLEIFLTNTFLVHPIWGTDKKSLDKFGNASHCTYPATITYRRNCNSTRFVENWVKILKDLAINIVDPIFIFLRSKYV